jgi:hypothetical protein
MRKGELIELSGRLATVKASTHNTRKALNEAKQKLADKFKNIDKMSEDDMRLKLGELYRVIADNILSFQGGLPDIEWFASGDFEDKELRELERDFLSI